jgi:hypothetical protein
MKNQHGIFSKTWHAQPGQAPQGGLLGLCGWQYRSFSKLKGKRGFSDPTAEVVRSSLPTHQL